MYPYTVLYMRVFHILCNSIILSLSIHLYLIDLSYTGSRFWVEYSIEGELDVLQQSAGSGITFLFIHYIYFITYYHHLTYRGVTIDLDYSL